MNSWLLYLFAVVFVFLLVRYGDVTVRDPYEGKDRSAHRAKSNVEDDCV